MFPGPGAACFGHGMVGTPPLAGAQQLTLQQHQQQQQQQQQPPQQQASFQSQAQSPGWTPSMPMAAMYVPVPVVMSMGTMPSFGQAWSDQAAPSAQGTRQGATGSPHIEEVHTEPQSPTCFGGDIAGPQSSMDARSPKAPVVLVSASTSDRDAASGGSPVSEGSDIGIDMEEEARLRVEEMFQVIRGKDPAVMAAHQDLRGDPNVEVRFVDVGISYKGRDDVLDMKKRLIKAIPDLSMSFSNLDGVGPRAMRVTSTWSGTQVEPFLPFFPCGRSARWAVQLSVCFNDVLKAKTVEFRFMLEPQMPLELSNLYGLAQSALSLASTASGSRMLQDGIQAATGEGQELLLHQLRGHVWETSECPHGNHVLQKYIVEVPPPLVGFIVDEFRGRAVAAAQHNTRSRVLERLLEHCPNEQTEPLARELLRNVQSLARHPFGNFVLQRLLEHGTAEQRHQMAAALVSQIGQLARHRQASNVVRCAIMHCCAEDKQMLAHALATAPRGLSGLARHSTGSFIVRELKLAGLTDVARGREVDATATTTAEWVA